MREVAAPPDQARGERVLATARLFLASASLLAIYLDPTEPRRFAPVAYGLMTTYVFWSFAIWGYLRIRPGVTARLPLVLHAIDLLWPAAITVFSEGPNSPFFFFFFFVLLSAAFRWGFRRTLYTAGVAVVVIWIQAAFIFGWIPTPLPPIATDLDLNRLIMRSSYIAIMGFLLAYLGEEEKQLRAEQAVIASVITQVRVEGGIRDALGIIADALLRLFDGRCIVLVATDTTTQQTFVWDFARNPAGVRGDPLELEPGQASQYTMTAPGEVWWHARDGASLALLHGGATSAAPLTIPHGFLGDYPHQALLGSRLEMGRHWLTHLYLLDPAVRIGATELQFLSSFLRHVAPALYNVYLLRRLRRQGGALERARVARELHDGAIQTLISAEMQLDVLRRAPNGLHSADELAHIQELLRGEVLNLRELMQQMRPIEVTPKQLLDFLADLADRFQRDTGIRTQFVSELDDTTNMSPRMCREVARVVQEALVNIRRHSGASNVLVRFGSTAGAWKLVIDDDGHGFPFSGRYSLSELDDAHKGPLVIKERVRSLGGELTVQSQQGSGARLEITLPHHVHPRHV